MTSRRRRLLRALREAGADDAVFDVLLLVGPVLILGIVALGRTLLTEALATAYLLAFGGRVVWRAIRS
ncbi:MAG: hypothetical protein ABEJ77_02630 [Halanaeroarchaeum sp.]